MSVVATMAKLTEEELSFHLNLRRDRPPQEQERANYENIRHLLAFSGKKVLDVGCGHGYLLSRLAAHNQVVGVDYIRDNPHGVPKRVADLDHERLPFRPASFDVIICSNVLEHLTRPLFVLRQIRTLLRPGGEAIIVLPNEYTLRNKVDLVLGRPLVSHQIDAFGHKYVAGVRQWSSFVRLVFPEARLEVKPPRERGLVGKASRLLAPLFPHLHAEQLIFVASR